MDGGAVPRVEWVAFDAEMSYGIMGARAGATWLHTYATTRAVRVLVLDGMSAAQPIEGFVRMNSGFEAVWCNFEDSESWRLVSKLNVTAPATGGAPPKDGPPGGSPPGSGPPGFRMPWAGMAGWEWVRAATWHYSLSPESRVIPDLCSFFTYYSPDFASFPNNLTTRKDRTSHRLTGVSKSDAEAFKAAIERKLVSNEQCSGLDWRRVTQDIMDLYGGRIKELKVTLSSNATGTAIHRQIVTAGELAYGGVMPFVADMKRDGAAERCSRAYTSSIPEETLSSQEILLRDTVESVLGRICGLFLDIFFESQAHPAESAIGEWRRETENLIQWLDWSMWRRCERRCRWDEVCAIALWPMIGFGNPEEWDQPRCINSSTVIERGKRHEHW